MKKSAAARLTQMLKGLKRSKEREGSVTLNLASKEKGQRNLNLLYLPRLNNCWTFMQWTATLSGFGKRTGSLASNVHTVPVHAFLCMPNVMCIQNRRISCIFVQCRRPSSLPLLYVFCFLVNCNIQKSKTFFFLHFHPTKTEDNSIFLGDAPVVHPIQKYFFLRLSFYRAHLRWF